MFKYTYVYTIYVFLVLNQMTCAITLSNEFFRKTEDKHSGAFLRQHNIAELPCRWSYTTCYAHRRYLVVQQLGGPVMNCCSSDVLVPRTAAALQGSADQWTYAGEILTSRHSCDAWRKPNNDHCVDCRCGQRYHTASTGRVLTECATTTEFARGQY